MSEPVREHLVEAVHAKLQHNQLVILSGERGFGQQATAEAAGRQLSGWSLARADGDWFRGGYLAGFQGLIDDANLWCGRHAPEIIEKHQQSLKRLFPMMVSPHFTVPKDLTNTSSHDERTRFYHHEYQNKLLVGLAEYLTQALCARRAHMLLLINNAADLSPTARSLISVILRTQDSGEVLKILLLDDRHRVFFDGAAELAFPPLSQGELQHAFGSAGQYPDEKWTRIHAASRGNALTAHAIIDCDHAGIPVVGYIDAERLISLYLASRPAAERLALLVGYIDADCASDDLIAMQNYRLCDAETADREHLRRHAACMADYHCGKSPLVILHAHRVRNKLARLEALTEPSEILKCIGLYDTWFSFFADMFADPALREHGSGDDAGNAVFINAAFVLYSLGCGSVSVPYLEEFHRRFPHSKYTPTVLYAQSMTYGRYQQPVDLPLAESYAMRNLSIIEGEFRGFRKYDYIKVFAENAYAYIKARQGKYDEALALCTAGNQRMLEIYGDGQFRLHQSILIYNTSQIYEITRNYQMAEQQLRLAISYDPYYGEYYNDLGNLLAKMKGRESEALDAYAEAIRLCPPYYEAHLNRGALLARLEDHEPALADFARVLEIKPAEPRAWFEIGTVRLRQGQFAAAVASFQAAGRIDPVNADLQCNLGLAYSELHSAETSIAHYRNALALEPNNAMAHNNMAIELFNAGQMTLAMFHADRAAQNSADPDYIETRDHIRKHCAAA